MASEVTQEAQDYIYTCEHPVHGKISASAFGTSRLDAFTNFIKKENYLYKGNYDVRVIQDIMKDSDATKADNDLIESETYMDNWEYQSHWLNDDTVSAMLPYNTGAVTVTYAELLEKLDETELGKSRITLVALSDEEILKECEWDSTYETTVVTEVTLKLDISHRCKHTFALKNP